MISCFAGIAGIGGIASSLNESRHPSSPPGRKGLTGRDAVTSGKAWTGVLRALCRARAVAAAGRLGEDALTAGRADLHGGPWRRRGLLEEHLGDEIHEERDDDEVNDGAEEVTDAD